MAIYPFQLWLRAIRAFSFTASVVPVLLGTAIAFWQIGPEAIRWDLMFLAVIGGLSLHAGTNLFSDFFDYKNGVDREETYGSSRVLVERLMNPRDMFVGGIVSFAIAFGIGVYLAWLLGWPIVMFGLIGIAGGYFYTANPIAYKYKALGEFLVFALMGPLMVWGGHFVQVGHLQWQPLLVSLPVGILVAAILFANNLRDIEDDNASGFDTQASLMGRKRARLMYGAMLFGAYFTLLGLVVFGLAPIAALIAVLTIPAALKVNKVIQESLKHERSHLAMVDVMTAQLHFQFGLLLVVGYVVGRFLNLSNFFGN
ncbi:1,4-dihydroxy-2-naphthoate octaprenyltransferase [bacterium]|nr:1,4-dihydroxy-2-naphthoate octaprenyltransferase [bacterium]